MQRFFLTDAALAPGLTVELQPLQHQLRRVLRAGSGDHIVLLDGSGSEFLTQLQMEEGGWVSGRILSQDFASGEPAVRVILYQCVLKADKFEWVLQKGTELGVSSFVPVISQRTIVRPAAVLRKKYNRWRAIIREAAEQCGRGRLPELAPPADLGTAVLEASGARFLPWEGAQGRQGLQAVLPADVPGLLEGATVSLLIGPEGGLAYDEVQAAETAGWGVISLGRRILRAETAALVAVTLAMHHCRELG